VRRQFAETLGEISTKDMKMKKYELIDFLLPFDDEIEIDIQSVKYILVGGVGKIVADISTNKKMYTLALAQFIGYVYGKSQDLTSLVSSMGLTKKEWEIMKKENEPLNLTDSEKEEIEEYFKRIEK